MWQNLTLWLSGCMEIPVYICSPKLFSYDAGYCHISWMWSLLGGTIALETWSLRKLLVKEHHHTCKAGTKWALPPLASVISLHLGYRKAQQYITAHSTNYIRGLMKPLLLLLRPQDFILVLLNTYKWWSFTISPYFFLVNSSKIQFVSHKYILLHYAECSTFLCFAWPIRSYEDVP